MPCEGEQGACAGPARRGSEGATRSPPVAHAHSPPAGRGVVEVAERLAAIEQRLAATEGGVARAEADRAGWNRVGDQLYAALARVGEAGVASPSEDRIVSAVRAEVGAHLAQLRKRLDSVEAVQAALRSELAKLPSAPATAEGQMKLARGIGKLNTRVSIIERDLRAFNEGVVQAVGDDE